MLERNILIIDDEEETEISIEAYKAIFLVLKKELGLNYNINFFWEKSITDAKKTLEEKSINFDSLVIDYDFPNEVKPQKGIHLVKKIRESINKRCKIVFYTMHAPHELDPSEFIDLINNDIYRFVPKDGDMLSLNYKYAGFNKSDQLIVEAIIDSLNDVNPISIALENYLMNFKNSSGNMVLNIEGVEYSIVEVLDSIRLYEDPGNKFVQNLLELSIMDYLELK
ncbi:hypothetical protein [Bacillus thuringiensis]|uniref:hypothetical protein n=1 Tax=Bacillus thuringiensis TaxID=1428 RepID=UPI000BF6F44D|nr:hypothetical protein [Bacillus thuringiensis]MED3634545.1 hypothetical protein [Bacillus thuringiensis]PEY74453.1 hypothetical protein CN355_07515 [Bacillus thuringiensis]